MYFNICARKTRIKFGAPDFTYLSLKRSQNQTKPTKRYNFRLSTRGRTLLTSQTATEAICPDTVTTRHNNILYST